MKYSDIFRLYSTSQPKDAIHQALREVPVDDSDEQYEDRSPLQDVYKRQKYTNVFH